MKSTYRTERWMIAGVLAAAVLLGWVAFVRNPPVEPPTRAGVSMITKGPSDKNAEETSTTSKAAASAQTRPTNTASPRRGSNKKVITDPAARKALRSVGFDPDAERYWLAAINNPFLPGDERQDLIEDLNEDGLIDPRGGAVDDLPLIENRIRLIEQLMPDAMDRVNTEAFKEAHKDLVNLQAKLRRQ